MIEIERQRLLEENPNADISEVNSVTVSLEEACWLMPTKVEDDFEFRGIPKEIKPIEIEGAEFLQVKMTLIRPDDIDFDVMVFASRKVLGNYEPKLGEAVEGFVWLQGHLIEN